MMHLTAILLTNFGSRRLLSAPVIVLTASSTLFGGDHPEATTFTDQTTQAGVAVSYIPSDTFIASQSLIYLMAGGAAAGDFNRDGWQDFFVLGGGANPDHLFINNGDGTFSDESEKWGIADFHMGVGVAAGDYDSDGWVDLYITSFGPAASYPDTGYHRLYHNNGDGSFTDVAAEAGVETTSTTFPDGLGAAFGDYDLDGDLDLFVCGWIGPSNSNELFRNNGDGTFTNVTAEASLQLDGVRGFSPRFVDMDGDRWPELLIAADFTTSRYLINNGDGTFTDATDSSGTGLDDNGMGQAVADFNNDGLLDWYVTSIFLESDGTLNIPGTGNMLYINQGGHFYYAEQSISAGVNDGGWGWGTAAIDIDHDGHVDLIETNGWPIDFNPVFVDELSKVFHNQGDGTFLEIAEQSGLVHSDQGRGLLHLDYDNDGDQDVVIISSSAELKLFRNDSATSLGNWLKISLDTSEVEALAPDGLGSIVRVTIDGITQTRSIDGGSQYLATSEFTAHFGVGDADTVDELRVEWANGQNTILNDVKVNQSMTISPAQPPITADLNLDGAVDELDLNMLLADWGTCERGGECLADFNQDQLINGIDLGLLLGSWSE